MKRTLSARFKNQVAVVTGGTGTLGRAFVRALLREGARVAFTFNRNASQAQTMVAEAGSEEKLRAYRADVREPGAAQEVIDDVLQVWGKVSVLINNAAVSRDHLLIGLSEADWHEVVDTTLDGAYSFSRPVVSHMVRSRQGAILNIGSISGLRGVRGQTNYCAAKAGLMGFTRALAVEVAPWGIRVNLLMPGILEDGMSAGLPARRRRELLAAVPCGRAGRAEEVVSLGLFLLSSQASYITGQAIAVDGGLAIL